MEQKELLKELRDAKVKIAQLESEKRQILIKKIKMFGDKYSQEELLEKDLDTLDVILDACEKFRTVEDEFPLPPETLTQKVISSTERIDFTKTFQDINEEFGM